MVSYQYQMLIALANFELGISVISQEIQECRKEFDSRSRVAKNFKQLVKCEIREDDQLLELWLNSNNKMNSPIKGISLFTKLIIEKLAKESESIPEKKELFNKIIVNKCLFKVVDVKEVKKIKLEKSEEKEDIQESITLKNETIKKENSFTIVGDGSISQANLNEIKTKISELKIIREKEEKILEEIIQMIERR